MSSPVITFVLLSALLTQANPSKTQRRQMLPRFSDYPVAEVWRGKAASVKLRRPEEFMFRTRLREGAKLPPNFAGHYRLVRWGCGAECMVGALVDLRTGQVFKPPTADAHKMAGSFSICQSAYYPSEVEQRANSRLMIVRCGLNFILRLNRNVPDTFYFVWKNNRFRLLKRLHTPPDY
ncbi:MAG: hypothetical protein HYR56_10545 [Acidobacteria bacterium]|nr:hypothetical protein [Acidobacteriota bacterium]MBI3425712.1 hypothetical protein [Acidobacteriota bacterium]